MIFSKEAIKNKIHHLDSIDAFPDLVESVVSSYVSDPFELIRLPRFWEPGGGSTCFRIVLDDRSYFLKVKHRSVFVESRLESEPDFNHRPSLENEAHFLNLIQSPRTPSVFFYEERDKYTFLALEYVTPFFQAVPGLDAEELLRAWENLVDFIRDLFARGIVHTDLHEGNLCFRDKAIVVCDFEEARVLLQDLPFAASLDYCGFNQYGDVGEFPLTPKQGLAGKTSLDRLRKVFKELIRDRLRDFLATCCFDQVCPYNADVLQAADSRIYQSIDLGGLSIVGQRPMRDNRKLVLNYLLFTQSRESKTGVIRHLDLGSNMGSFCFMAAALPYVSASLGLEAFNRYVTAANILRFVADLDKASFHQFVCGKTSFDSVGYAGAEVCSMLSVYHHIDAREEFFDGLGRHRPMILLAEFAIQARYYPERKNVTAEIEYIRTRLDYRYAFTLMTSQDYRRPLILFTDEMLTNFDKFFFYLASLRGFTPAPYLLTIIERLLGKPVQESRAHS